MGRSPLLAETYIAGDVRGRISPYCRIEVCRPFASSNIRWNWDEDGSMAA
jgi:hypothetical protein